MNLLDDMDYMGLSAVVQAGSWGVEVIARKVAIGVFGTSWKLSLGWVDILAPTVVLVRHDGQQVLRGWMRHGIRISYESIA
jgi:hypothetical protein